jgi:hypothetical protein
VHVPDELLPPMTSQYDPSAIEVLNAVVHAESALLMATKPDEPMCNSVAATHAKSRAEKCINLDQRLSVGSEEKPSLS